MQVCGYAGLRYAVRRWKGIGHMSVVFTVMHLAEVLLFSHPMLVGRVLVPWFLSHPMPLRIWIVLCTSRADESPGAPRSEPAREQHYIWIVCTLLSFRFHGSRRIMGVFESAGDCFLSAAFVSLKFV